jgi:hypothetical protein
MNAALGEEPACVATHDLHFSLLISLLAGNFVAETRSA